MDNQAKRPDVYTSGTVVKTFIGEKHPDWKAAATLVRKIAENYEMPYYTMSPTYSVCSEHGYLSGEVWECPVCHKKTEVYSRITGYYRPVQNWNVGKAEEFEERKEYDIPNSRLKRNGLSKAKADYDVFHPEAEGNENGILLFTTKTCPNCRLAKASLDKAGLKYQVIDAEENPDLCRKYKVMQAPTLVAFTDGVATTISNASQIRAFAESAV